MFGAGAPAADMGLVGEQPGDQEDKAGTPFVGPARTSWCRICGSPRSCRGTLAARPLEALMR